MADRQRSVSTKDVAALAGVSIGTVSNVLNAPHKVAEATRLRVNEAIRELGWERNENARQLRAGRSNTIGMLVPNLYNPHFAELFHGAEEFLYERGYIVNVSNANELPEREELILDQFRRQRVGGVMMAPVGAAMASAANLMERQIPVVLLDEANNSEFSGVGSDNFTGGLLAGHHLIDQGHHRIAFVGACERLVQVRDRLRGCQVAVQAHPGASLRVISTAQMDPEAGRRAAEEILKLDLPFRPTAVFCASDLVAMGFLQGMTAAGLRVPEQMAIIGYDDIDFAASAAVPLSSIRQPTHQMGREAASLLLGAMNAISQTGEMPRISKLFNPDLVVRESTLRS